MKNFTHHISGKWRCLLAVGLLIFLAGGCKPQNTGMENIDYVPFVAPSLSPTKQPTPTPEKKEPTNTPIPIHGMEVESSAGCTDNLVFVQDLSIPDGTVVVAGSTLDKQWEVENTGTCDWGEGYTFRLYTGLPLNSEAQLEMPAVKAGERVTIRLMLTAPASSGYYMSAWQACNPDGVEFGDPIYIDFTVQ